MDSYQEANYHNRMLQIHPANRFARGMAEAGFETVQVYPIVVGFAQLAYGLVTNPVGTAESIAEHIVADPFGFAGKLTFSALTMKMMSVLGRNPKSCFPAGTLVHTSEGVKAIEQIAAGDRVWAFDHKQFCWAEREVVEVYQLLHRGTMATVQVKGETIRATGGHSFWVVRGEGLAERPLPVRIAAYEADGRQEGRWVLARDLRAGDEVFLRHGEVVALEAVRLDEVEETVYNFHVAELQNYAVGECGVLVHNTNDPPQGPGQSEFPRIFQPPAEPIPPRPAGVPGWFEPVWSPERGAWGWREPPRPLPGFPRIYPPPE